MAFYIGSQVRYTGDSNTAMAWDNSLIQNHQFYMPIVVKMAKDATRTIRAVEQEGPAHYYAPKFYVQAISDKAN